MMLNCAVKLFVAATPISGPQPIPITTDDSWAKDDVRILTIDRILALAFFAIFTASKTSAFSPLCDIAIRIEFGSIVSGVNDSSLDMIGSTLILAYFCQRYFATSAAL